MNDLAQRKRLLVQEAEAQRELLLSDLDQLRLAATVWQRRLRVVSRVGSVLGVLTPVVASWLRFRTAAKVERELKPKRGLLNTVLTGWRWYRKVVPVVQGFMRHR